MVACAVINCTVRSGQGFAMFKFPDPERDSERRKQWVDSIKLMKVDYKPTPFARVCERHFQNDQFVVDPSLAESIGFQQKKLRLKDNAVPTVFTPYDSEDKVSKQRNGVKRPKRRPRKRKKIEESEDSETCSSSDTEPYDPTDYNVLENDPEQLTGHTLDTQTNLTQWMKSKKGIWKKVICALARKMAAVAPTFVEKRNLAANGLGDKVVEFPEDGSVEEVQVAIIREFPRLVEVGGFDFVCTQGKTRHLYYIEPLDVNGLFNLKPGDGNLYVRPRKMDIDIDKSLVYEKNGNSAYGECQICGKLMPLDGIEYHVKHCRYFQKEKQVKEKQCQEEPVMDVKQEVPSNIVVEFKQSCQPLTKPMMGHLPDDGGQTCQPAITASRNPTDLVSRTDQKSEEIKVSSPQSVSALRKEMLLTLKDREHPHELGRNLYQLQRKSVACDLLLNGKDNSTIFAHKVVFLACGSHFIKDLLLQSDKNKTSTNCTIINFPIYPYTVLETLVRYVYTGDILVPVDHAERFFALCGTLQLSRAQEILLPYINVKNIRTEVSQVVMESPSLQNTAYDQTAKLHAQKIEKNKKAIFNPPKKLSEKLRDIMQKNEVLFNDVGINSDTSTKLHGYQVQVIDTPDILNNANHKPKPTRYSIKTEDMSKQLMLNPVVEILDNTKDKSTCRMFVKASSFNSDISDEVKNSVTDGKVIVKSEPMYALVENIEPSGLDDHQFLASNSSDKFLTSNDYNVSTVSPRRTTLISDDQIENELIENSSNFHGDYDPTIVIKAEPPCDYEDWQNRHSLGLDLPVVPEALSNVTIKEEPMN